jgi:hypothetical protein
VTHLTDIRPHLVTECRFGNTVSSIHADWGNGNILNETCLFRSDGTSEVVGNGYESHETVVALFGRIGE